MVGINRMVPSLEYSKDIAAAERPRHGGGNSRRNRKRQDFVAIPKKFEHIELADGMISERQIEVLPEQLSEAASTDRGCQGRGFPKLRQSLRKRRRIEEHESVFMTFEARRMERHLPKLFSFLV